MAKQSNMVLTENVLLAIGGINWGLALFNVNLVGFLSAVPYLDTIVYAAIGLSGVHALTRLKQ